MSEYKTPVKNFLGRLTPSNCPNDPQSETHRIPDAIRCAWLIYLGCACVCEHACTPVLYL